jgi:uncharacterized membrane protein
MFVSPLTAGRCWALFVALADDLGETNSCMMSIDGCTHAARWNRSIDRYIYLWTVRRQWTVVYSADPVVAGVLVEVYFTHPLGTATNCLVELDRN